MKSKKTFSIIPYLIQVFVISFTKVGRILLLFHKPGDKTPKDTSIKICLKKGFRGHPGDIFVKSKNLNIIGEFSYFLLMQIAGILFLVSPLIWGIIYLIIKIIHMTFIIIFTIMYSISIICYHVYKLIMLRTEKNQFQNQSI